MIGLLWFTVVLYSPSDWFTVVLYIPRVIGLLSYHIPPRVIGLLCVIPRSWRRDGHPGYGATLRAHMGHGNVINNVLGSAQERLPVIRLITFVL